MDCVLVDMSVIGPISIYQLTKFHHIQHGLTELSRTHWLDVPERVKYKVIILTRRCLIGTAPRFPRWHGDVIYAPPLVISSSCRLNSCGLWAFSLLSSRLWNSLPRLLRDISHNTTSFGHSLNLKTFFSLRVLLHRLQRIRGFFLDYAMYIVQIYVLLTYLLTFRHTNIKTDI